MGEAAFQLVKERFSPAKMIADTLVVYQVI